MAVLRSRGGSRLAWERCVWCSSAAARESGAAGVPAGTSNFVPSQVLFRRTRKSESSRLNAVAAVGQKFSLGKVLPSLQPTSLLPITLHNLLDLFSPLSLPFYQLQIPQLSFEIPLDIADTATNIYLFSLPFSPKSLGSNGSGSEG